MGLLEQLIVELPEKDVPGSYDEDRQTWSVEVAAELSPQKHHQEN